MKSSVSGRSTASKAKLATVSRDEGSRRGKAWLRIAGNLSSLIYLMVLFLISCLPVRLAFQMAAWLGRIRYWRPRTTIDRQAAYVETRMRTSPEQARAWLRRSFELATIQDLECWLYPRLTKDTLGQLVQFEGLENLTNALARGKGAIVYSGHTASRFTVFIALGLIGHASILVKSRRDFPQHNWIQRRFFGRRIRLMEKLGFRFLWQFPPNPMLAAQAAAALRDNKIVLILIDSRAPQANDVDAEFVNENASFSPGSVMLARVSGAPLIDVWVHRPAVNLPLTVKIGTAIYVKGDHVPYVQQQAARLEAEILADPPSWYRWLF